MKIIELIRKSAFLLLLGATALVYGQEQRDETKPVQPEPRPEASKPAQDEPARPEAKQNNEDKPVRSDDKPAKPEDPKATRQAEHEGQAAEHAPADQHGRIPDDKFRANFGREHAFTVHRTIVDGQPRFQYGGYSFNIVDAWPVGWSYTDQCYVDYIDGQYFLIDLAHPGVRLALVVVG
jgi:hypothetical protein